jgi:hypothetical protein
MSDPDINDAISRILDCHQRITVDANNSEVLIELRKAAKHLVVVSTEKLVELKRQSQISLYP